MLIQILFLSKLQTSQSSLLLDQFFSEAFARACHLDLERLLDLLDDRLSVFQFASQALGVSHLGPDGGGPRLHWRSLRTWGT